MENSLKEVITQIFGIAENVPELNMNNYNEDEVRRLNDAMIEIYLICEKVCVGKDDEQSTEQQCNIADVSGRSELLFAFLKYLDEHDKAAWITHAGVIKEFLNKQ
jgi:hypothetical protein